METVMAMLGAMNSQTLAQNQLTALRITQDVTAVPFSHQVIFQDFAQNCLVVGHEAVTAVLQTFFNAFNHSSITHKHIQADEDSARLELLLTGRQVAPFWGLPCTGRTVTLALEMGCRFYEEQVTHVELHYDAGALLRQLGLAL
ncbi:MAG: ester cyclase [Candidatus Promineifilaceae bacterium]